MVTSARGLNRATLHRQLLLERRPLAVADALKQILAIQAQEPASPYLALWNRIAGFDSADLDAAFADGTVLKSTLMRVTLHAAHAEDHPLLYQAMLGAIRSYRMDGPRFRHSGLSPAIEEQLPALMRFLRTPRTNAEVDAWFKERLGDTGSNGPWWALRLFAPVTHAPTGGPWSFGPRPSYLAARTHTKLDQSAAVAELARRYFGAFGPATLADLARFAKLTRGTLRAAVAALGDDVVSLEGADGRPLLDIRGGVLPDEDVPAPPRLMAMWDSTLLAFDDRTRIVPDAYRSLIVRSNGDTLPTILVDGEVAGVWRPVDGGIEVTAFHRLTAADWDGLEFEAAELVGFLADRDPRVYRRYARWWNALPAEHVRVLPG